MNTSSIYSELLLEPAWKDKREYVLDTQGRYCNRSLLTSRQQVHHRYYRTGALPWEYPDECFEVLCRPCHRIEHGFPPERSNPPRQPLRSFSRQHSSSIRSCAKLGRVSSPVASQSPLALIAPELTEEQVGYRRWCWGLVVGGIFFGGIVFPIEPATFFSWLPMLGVFWYGGYLSV